MSARDETLTAFLADLASRHGATPAIHYGDETVSFAALDEESRRVATGLSQAGVGPGDRVALWLPNMPAYLAVFFACARLGAVAVAVNTRFRSAEVEDIVGRSRAKALVMWPGFKAIDFIGILNEVDPAALDALETVVLYDEGDPAPAKRLASLATARYADLAGRPAMDDERATPETGVAVFTTSGTTSKPKFVLHCQRALSAHGRQVAHAFGYDAADATMLQALPLCGVYGFSQAMATLASGRPMVLMPVFDGAAAAREIARHRVTHMNGSDEMYWRIFEAQDDTGADLSSLRRCGFASFNTDPETFIAEADGGGVPAVGLYGMSEVQALFSSRDPAAPPGERRKGGGTPVSPDARVRARDPESGALLPDGEPGELEIKGPSVFVEYLDNAEATAAAFTEDGYVRTGDLGATEPGGGFEFLSRMGDALRLGGYLVNPAEITAYLERHPSVAEAQAVGVPGARGTQVAAFVTLAPGQSFDEPALVAHCREGMARFKVPARIFALDEFPMAQSANGLKIQRARLRDWAGEWMDRQNPASGPAGRQGAGTVSS